MSTSIRLHRLIRLQMGVISMNKTVEITRNVNGEQRREKALLEWQDGDDPKYQLHKLALAVAASPEGQKQFRGTGLSCSEFLSRATNELLADGNMSIKWLDRDAVNLDDQMLVSRYELESYLELMGSINRHMRRTCEVSVQYVRRLARLHAEGHPLVSSWDDVRMHDRSLSWAWQFVQSEADELYPGRFFEKRLAEAVHRAGMSPQNGNDEQDTPQNADATDEQNIPQAG